MIGPARCRTPPLAAGSISIVVVTAQRHGIDRQPRIEHAVFGVMNSLIDVVVVECARNQDPLRTAIPHLGHVARIKSAGGSGEPKLAAGAERIGVVVRDVKTPAARLMIAEPAWDLAGAERKVDDPDETPNVSLVSGSQSDILGGEMASRAFDVIRMPLPSITTYGRSWISALFLARSADSRAASADCLAAAADCCAAAA